MLKLCVAIFLHVLQIVGEQQMFDPETEMARDSTAEQPAVDQTAPPREKQIVHLWVTRPEAERRMRDALWREDTIELILKTSWIKTWIPIGDHRLMIVEQ